MRRLKIFAVMMLALAVMGGCGSSSGSQDGAEGGDVVVKINDAVMAVEWEDNESVKALKASAPLRVEMHRYGGFEQVGELGRSLPRNDVRITTEPGDIVLYSGNQIVIFYGSNTWAYTRLGKIAGKTQQELTELLGDSDVTLTISAE